MNRSTDRIKRLSWAVHFRVKEGGEGLYNPDADRVSATYKHAAESLARHEKARGLADSAAAAAAVTARTHKGRHLSANFEPGAWTCGGCNNRNYKSKKVDEGIETNSCASI